MFSVTDVNICKEGVPYFQLIEKNRMGLAYCKLKKRRASALYFLGSVHHPSAAEGRETRALSAPFAAGHHLL
jgi:hypothetical protein